MKNIVMLSSQLLSCGYLDIEMLDNLLTTYNLELDIDEIRMNFWGVNNVNILIYEAFTQIKDMFMSENYDEITKLWFQCDDLEEWADFEIYTNYMDSHLWFNHEKLDELYQNWRKD